MFFIRKEFKEIFACKKLLVYLLIAVFYQTILNMIANTPIIPLEKLLFYFTFINASLAIEIVYVTMSEEIKKGTFDIILLSKLSKYKIIILKCFVPVMLTFVVSMFGIIINNLLAQFINKMITITYVNMSNIFFVILAVIAGSLFGMFIIIKRNETNNNFLTLSIAINSICFMFLFYLSNRTNVMFGIVFACILIIIIWRKLLHSLAKRNNTYFVKHSSISFSSKDITINRCIWKRDIIRLFKRKLVFGKIAILSLLLFFVCMQNSVSFVSEIYIALILLFINTVCVLDIYYDTMKEEKYSNMEEIILMSKISISKNYNVFLTGIMVCALIYTVIITIGFVLLKMYSVAGICFMQLTVSLPINLLICKYAICKFLKSEKDERILRIFLYLVCLSVFLLVLYFSCIFII